MLKDSDVDKVMGQVMRGHLKPAGECLAAVQAASRAPTERQSAIGKDRCIASEGKGTTSYFLLTNAVSYGICHKVLSFVQPQCQ